jgi:protein-disulfide isomerase
VSGAEQTQDKRSREGAQAVAAARSGGGGRMVIAGVAIIVALIVVVGGALFFQHRNQPQNLGPAIPVAAAGPQYPVTVQGDAIVTGSPQAPVTIDIYEDFLCPHCGQFEHTYHPQLAQAAADGKAKVVYHPVAILDSRSVPPGYSTLAAGATFCAANAGVFPRFHDSLFAHQPVEGGPAWTTAQLQQLGTALGASNSFTSCVQNGANEQRIATATDKASDYISGLRSDHLFGTPTVLVNGKIVPDTSTSLWLDQALNGANR